MYTAFIIIFLVVQCALLYNKLNRIVILVIGATLLHILSPAENCCSLEQTSAFIILDVFQILLHCIRYLGMFRNEFGFG